MHFFEARAEMCKRYHWFFGVLEDEKKIFSDLLAFTIYIAWKNALLFQKRFHHIVARTLRNALLSQFPTYSMCSSFVCKFPVLRRFQITANIGLSQEEKRSPWYIFHFYEKYNVTFWLASFCFHLKFKKVADKQCRRILTKTAAKGAFFDYFYKILGCFDHLPHMLTFSTLSKSRHFWDYLKVS